MSSLVGKAHWFSDDQRPKPLASPYVGQERCVFLVRRRQGRGDWSFYGAANGSAMRCSSTCHLRRLRPTTCGEKLRLMNENGASKATNSN
ncbi:unnamed protein product, partial [Iphiclides podalirius]